MTQLLEYFSGQAKQHHETAIGLMDKADKEGRDLSTEEMAEVESATSLAKDYREKAAKERDKVALRRQLEDEGSGLGDGITTESGAIRSETGIPSSIGEAFVQSGVFKGLFERKTTGRLAQRWKTESVHIPWQFKAAANPVLESNETELFGTGGAAGALTTLFNSVESPSFVFPRLTIADLMASVPVTVGNSVTYPTVNGRTALVTPGGGFPSTLPIAEGANKASIGYDFTAVTAVLIKLAAYTKLSEELLEDAPAIAAYINADLPFQIRQAEEEYLASVLYNSVTDASALGGSTTDFDQILSAITAVEIAGGMPDGMLITPTNWAELRVAKYGTGAGDKSYVGGGPFTPTNNPWGLRVVVSAAATADHPLIGDFARGAKVYRKGGLSVDATNSDGTDFIKNLVTIRAEERLVLGKTYPEFFKKANLA